jgi:DNA-damage-inducible protein J
MTTANINIRMDAEIKKQAETIFDAMGMNMTTAINIFVRQVIRQGKIPFEIGVDVPNSETRAAMQEALRIVHDPHSQGYTDVHQMFKDIVHDSTEEYK